MEAHQLALVVHENTSIGVIDHQKGYISSGIILINHVTQGDLL